MSIDITTISNSFRPLYTSYFYLSGEFCIFEEKSLKANEVYDTINHFFCNFAKYSPILSQAN